MQNRILVAGSFLLAAAAAWAPSVSAQAKPQRHHQTVPCATGASHAGGAYLVIPGGAAEKILRATPAPAPAPASHKVTHSMPHGKSHTKAHAVPHAQPHVAPATPKVHAHGCQPHVTHKR